MGMFISADWGHQECSSTWPRTWTAAPADLPAGSPFRTITDARRFAGPLPYTFDYERSGRIVAVRATRASWDPQPVSVQVHELAFFTAPPFGAAKPRLANAFYVAGVDYRWERGERLVPASIDDRRSGSIGR
jgi:hypothetical protein